MTHRISPSLTLPRKGGGKKKRTFSSPSPLMGEGGVGVIRRVV
jgi:hypothetical protein